MNKDYFDYVDVYFQYIRGEISLLRVARLAGVKNAVMLAGSIFKQKRGIYCPTYWSRSAGNIGACIGALDVL